MDDRIGRLDTKIGVDRTATEQAACSVAYWSTDIRPARDGSACVRRTAVTSHRVRRAIGHVHPGVQCISRYFGRTASAEDAHPHADNGIVDQANLDERAKDLMGAAGIVAGAIRSRGQRI